METTLRYCEDIGMYAYDRQISASCVHATDFCRATCFNDKLYKLYPAMHGKDIRNEAYWRDINGAKVAKDLSRRKKQTNRVRLMTRGEAFSNYSDVARVESILTDNPNRLFWIPTRSWRNPILRIQVERIMRQYPNARIMASMDITNTAEEWESLTFSGWSTMSYGENNATHTPDLQNRLFKCPKTFKKLNGHCAICKAGCFSSKQVHVHLKQH